MKYSFKTILCTVALSCIVLAASGEVGRSIGVAEHSAAVADSTTAAKQKQFDDQPKTEGSIIDQVVWVVGDEAILKSDVEAMRLQGEMEGVKWNGDPDCIIPEQLAVQKLFLHQAALDSIEVTESEISKSVDQQINYWISNAGSREKLEECKK